MSESTTVKPIVVVSKCLGFDKCRYNGITLPSEQIDMLTPFVQYVTVCPEVEIGLGVPRHPIRLVQGDEAIHLFQSATERDITDEMHGFSSGFLNSLDVVDGFILKDRSPSCGVKDVKLYSAKGYPLNGTESGLFAAAVAEQFPNLPIETEGRLSNFSLREHFLIRLFTLTRFRLLRHDQSMKNLVDFHARNKFLIQAYNESMMRKMGKVVANHEKISTNEVYDLYQQLLYKALQKKPRFTTNINILMHVLGFVSKYLAPREKEYFLQCLGRYRSRKIPLSVPVGIIKAHLIKYDVSYMLDQTYFEPYPEDLASINDSGKGRIVT